MKQENLSSSYLLTLIILLTNIPYLNTITFFLLSISPFRYLQRAHFPLPFLIFIPLTFSTFFTRFRYFFLFQTKTVIRFWCVQTGFDLLFAFSNLRVKREVLMNLLGKKSSLENKNNQYNSSKHSGKQTK